MIRFCSIFAWMFFATVFYGLLVLAVTPKGRRWLRTKHAGLASRRLAAWQEPVRERGITGWVHYAPPRVFPLLIAPSFVALAALTQLVHVVISHKVFMEGIAIADTFALIVLCPLVFRLLLQTRQAIREVNASGWMRAYRMIER